ncbi:MAG: YicC/YloC family endoribonuclease [Verrucomicrobiota bacterium]
MNSMTGYGVAESKSFVGNYRIRVEVSSINSRKGLDVVINIPRLLLAIERSFRDFLDKNLRRGRVILNVTLEECQGNSRGSVIIDEELLEDYREQIKKVEKKLKLGPDDPGIEFFLTLPGVVKTLEKEASLDLIEKETRALFQIAFNRLIKARQREGAFLCRELQKTVVALQKEVKELEIYAPQVTDRARKSMRQRLKEAELDIKVDDERLVKEIAFFADRSDITEELTRFKGHLAELKRMLKDKTTIGRSLDFMLQEMGREVNTIGSKSNNGFVSHKTVALKTELEKIREQAQNFE